MHDRNNAWKNNNYMNDMVYVYAWMNESQSSSMTISKGYWNSSLLTKNDIQKNHELSKSNIA